MLADSHAPTHATYRMYCTDCTRRGTNQTSGSYRLSDKIFFCLVSVLPSSVTSMVAHTHSWQDTMFFIPIMLCNSPFKTFHCSPCAVVVYAIESPGMKMVDIGKMILQNSLQLARTKQKEMSKYNLLCFFSI